MHDLIQQLTSTELAQIGDELEKLFVLQDRPFGLQQKILFTREIAATGYPFASIIKGIRSLLTEDLKRITAFTIIDATKKHAREFIDAKLKKAERDLLERYTEQQRGKKECA